LTSIYAFQYLVTQNVIDANNNRASSTFYENYTFDFLDSQDLNFTFSTNCQFYEYPTGTPDSLSSYMDYTIDSPSRLINHTIADSIYDAGTEYEMNYLGTHIRLYADGSVPVGGVMLSNNIELGYRWGIYTLHDISMTRVANAYYSLGVLTYNALIFQGSDSVSSGIPCPT